MTQTNASGHRSLRQETLQINIMETRMEVSAVEKSDATYVLF